MSGGGGRGSVDCELSEMIEEVEWDERYEWELARSMAPRLLYQRLEILRRKEKLYRARLTTFSANPSNASRATECGSRISASRALSVYERARSLVRGRAEDARTKFRACKDEDERRRNDLRDVNRHLSN